MEKIPNHAFKETSLHKAADAGDLALCRQLLEEGADANALDQYGWSPLVRAVQGGHLEVAKLLLDAGSLLHYRYQREDTAEERASETQKHKMLEEQLNSHEAMKEAFKDLPEDIANHILSDEWREKMTQSMVDFHFQPTVEHAIEHCGDLEMLKLLVVDYNADINNVASDGSWPLSDFAEADDIEAVTWLLDNGADPNTTSTGETAIFKAIRNDNHAIVQLLVERGAKVDVEDVDGWSVLFPCRSVAMAKYLIEQGADPTSLDQAEFPCWNWIDDKKTRNFLKQEALKRGLKNWTTL